MTPQEAERTDEVLMQAYASGDAGAFQRLFERYRRPLFTFLLHQTGSRGLAEDLFQEVFLRLIRRREQYQRRGGFRAWLYTIARNVLTDARRRAALRRTENREDPVAHANEVADAGAWDRSLASQDVASDPVSSSQAGELRERIADALLGLPAEQREVFLLRERAGLDFAAIAKVTDCALGTVKSRMRYALAGLRRHLADQLVSIPETLHE